MAFKVPISLKKLMIIHTQSKASLLDTGQTSRQLQASEVSVKRVHIYAALTSSHNSKDTEASRLRVTLNGIALPIARAA